MSDSLLKHLPALLAADEKTLDVKKTLEQVREASFEEISNLRVQAYYILLRLIPEKLRDEDEYTACIHQLIIRDLDALSLATKMPSDSAREHSALDTEILYLRDRLLRLSFPTGDALLQLVAEQEGAYEAFKTTFRSLAEITKGYQQLSKRFSFTKKRLLTIPKRLQKRDADLRKTRQLAEASREAQLKKGFKELQKVVQQSQQFLRRSSVISRRLLAAQKKLIKRAKITETTGTP